MDEDEACKCGGGMVVDNRAELISMIIDCFCIPKRGAGAGQYKTRRMRGISSA